MKFVFDIDGTLCFNGQCIDAPIITSLKQLQQHGHELIFASARPIRDLLPVLPAEFHNHTLIGANGAMYSQQQHIQVIRPISNQIYQHIIDIITKYNLDYIIDDDWNYAAHIDADNAIYERLDPHKLAHCISMSQISAPIKVILLNIEPTAITAIQKELTPYQNHLEIINHSNEFNIDITAKDINKYTALQYIYGRDVEYIAFGNDHNDIVMLQHASQGFIVDSTPHETSMIIDMSTIQHLNNNSKELANKILSFI
ncbi:Cof-type HAD-IIB family hydrolase [Staphylococcus simiae]|uniref:Cof-type HAD-IIB family hydrolase n=1 Tax=Staphylococcus simiae TaxID=308354 RepID=UPI001A976564|nr:Cof-type HAD-IIB family hydrolase [Staphylococcus simiae]MBO1197784.1 Cof-type HAD-IIB family hydrolase [Staphylococcus simiae]MBO1200554.1 Cof-type HAD-IIB family hydrolase [Staphylococcus simiae]MBO1202826.1 Cof-type HAD-IIB family hydrolase [Staphylococcus simiae]MBO1211408.1 Cof-type HAD-IIB family hydrolase [Staphylococcus simiae]MBO1229785.1 Cof-type HAD-IIB family hydrolase [Staphylococcus simiae]